MPLHGPDDRWRVLLKGQLQDYIHATNINVREDNVNKNINFSFIHSLLFLQNCKLASENSNKTLSVSLCDTHSVFPSLLRATSSRMLTSSLKAPWRAHVGTSGRWCMTGSVGSLS